jgi:cytochrome c biogenesis protein CcmG, thiol:disulfide interchange protein DsbE
VTEPRPGLARWLILPLMLVLAACTAEARTAGPAGEPAPPFADCSALLAAPAATSGAAASRPAAARPAPSGVAGATADLPDVSLPCFTGGQAVKLTELRGPAVINLWGSWCPPCREELPILQELADRTAGRLHVVGVDTFDSRDAAASFAADNGVTFPTLYDPDKKLMGALGKVDLPVTVFVGAAGQRHVYTGGPLDRPELGRLVRTWTGVSVTS